MRKVTNRKRRGQITQELIERSDSLVMCFEQDVKELCPEVRICTLRTSPGGNAKRALFHNGKLYDIEEYVKLGMKMLDEAQETKLRNWMSAWPEGIFHVASNGPFRLFARISNCQAINKAIGRHKTPLGWALYQLYVFNERIRFKIAEVVILMKSGRSSNFIYQLAQYRTYQIWKAIARKVADDLKAGRVKVNSWVMYEDSPLFT